MESMNEQNANELIELVETLYSWVEWDPDGFLGEKVADAIILINSLKE